MLIVNETIVNGSKITEYNLSEGWAFLFGLLIFIIILYLFTRD